MFSLSPLLALGESGTNKQQQQISMAHLNVPDGGYAFYKHFLWGLFEMDEINTEVGHNFLGNGPLVLG